MKRILLIIVLLMAFVVNIFSLDWGKYWLMKPSELPKGDGVSVGYFTDSRFPTVKYEIYVDVDFSIYNGEWVYSQWMQDHGWWYTNRGTWQGDGYSRDPIRGALYIDPYEKVAIYFYPLSGFDVYRVRVLKK